LLPIADFFAGGPGIIEISSEREKLFIPEKNEKKN